VAKAAHGIGVFFAGLKACASTAWRRYEGKFQGCEAHAAELQVLILD
jgi:hypothetical protein